MGQAGLERLAQVDQQGAGGDEARLLVVEAKACRSSNAKMLVQNGAGGRRIEVPVRPRGTNERSIAPVEPVQGRFGQQALRRGQAAQLVFQLSRHYIRGLKLTG